MKKEYRIYRISYSQKRDSFSSWVYVGDDRDPDWDEFDLKSECYCQKWYDEATGTLADKAEMIHYTMLTDIREAVRNGYTVQFRNRPE